MSKVFSDTTNKNGIIQGIERNLYGNDGDGRISGNAVLLAQFTDDVNSALDKVLSIIFQSDGTWQFDDSGHTDYPIITTDLVSGQRDYSFVSDENGNLILDIYKVLIKTPEGVFNDMDSVDVQTDASRQNTERGSGRTGLTNDLSPFYDGRDAGGTPYRYDKTANAIFLDPIPDYNSTGGLKIYINREGSYFSTSDTTKKPGFAGLFHKYLIIEPSANYAAINTLSNAVALNNQRIEMEKAIEEYYSKRNQDVQKRFIPAQHSNK